MAGDDCHESLAEHALGRVGGEEQLVEACVCSGHVLEVHQGHVNVEPAS